MTDRASHRLALVVWAALCLSPTTACAQAGDTLTRSAAQFGHRQAPGDAAANRKPLARIDNRIQNRIDTRVRNRVERGDVPDLLLPTVNTQRDIQLHGTPSQQD